MQNQHKLITLIQSENDFIRFTRLVESMSKYGGDIQEAEWLIFSTWGQFPGYEFQWKGNWTYEFPGSYPARLRYPFADKVSAFAKAEMYASGEDVSLVWINPECLFFQPPDMFMLNGEHKAAVRPVHHVNIGSRSGEEMDPFWRGIYDRMGLDEAPFTMRSFLDLEEIRPYYNTHAFSIRSGAGIGKMWQEIYSELVLDEDFQASGCQDIRHKIFLHQAVLSTLLARELKEESIFLLPDTYNYPLNLHEQVPDRLRPARIDELVSVVYEEEDDLKTFQIDRILPDLLDG